VSAGYNVSPECTSARKVQDCSRKLMKHLADEVWKTTGWSPGAVKASTWSPWTNRRDIWTVLARPLGVVVHRVIVHRGTVWKAAAWASVRVRLGA